MFDGVDKDIRGNFSAVLVVGGGFVTLFYAFYYIQQLSFVLGIYYGVSGAIKLYGISASSSVLSGLAQSSTLALALRLSHILLPFALAIFAIGLLLPFTKAYLKRTIGVALILASVSISQLPE